ncbi:MAG: cell division protein ZapB [Synergistetes bacterium]|nr:cell division protein ZapB [Synergistota bacterium]MCX8127385.1 cell division protein ZapB [Synergistota bacterium]MDW8192249.1 cell division protein ZapB [Synergistota bacterium]
MLEELKALEEKIDSLVALVGKLREENRALKEELSKVNEKLKTYEELEKERERFLMEKKDMEDRIKRIFSKLVSVVNKESK